MYTVYILAFLFGIILQATIMVRGHISRPKLLLMIAGSGLLLSLLYFSSISGPLMLAVAAAWFVYLVVTFPFVFKLDILPVISRRSLVALTTIFWFVYFIFYQPILGQVNPLVLELSCVFTAGVIVIALFNVPLVAFWRIFCYGWFLIVLTALNFYQTNFPLYHYFLSFGRMSAPSMLEVVVGGMAAFYLALNLWYAIHLLPVSLFHRQKSTTYAIWEWRLDMVIFSRKYLHDSSLIPLDALLIALVCGSLLFLNNHFGWLADGAMVDLLILIVGSWWTPKTRWA